MAQLATTLFSPCVPAVLLLILRFVPLATLGPIRTQLSDSHVGFLETLLKWILGFGIFRLVNSILSEWANNKWLWIEDRNLWNHKGDIAVVTGGSNGIGLMVVKGLVSHGFKVAVLDVQPLPDDLEKDSNVSFYMCDIASRTAVHKAGESVRSGLGSPSILVNNAGIGNAHAILEATPESLRAIFDVNIVSHWYTVQEFLPDMISKKKGHIMSVASMASFVGLAGMVDYSCTKVGLLAFHEGLNQELKYRYNCPQIKTTIVHPYWTRTRLVNPIQGGLKRLGASLDDPRTVADAMVQQILKGKSGQMILGPTIASAVRAFPAWLQECIRDGGAKAITVKATTAVA